MHWSAFRVFSLWLLFPFIVSSPSAGQYRFLENGSSVHRGSDTGFLLDTPTRIKIDLSGSWTYTVDGVQGTVRIPAAYDFKGSVMFHRSFELTQEQLDRYVFHIVSLGVSHTAEITVNGEFVTSHVGGYSSIVEPIGRNVLQAGRLNDIRVEVSNELDARSTLPLRPAVLGSRNYGGITRDIYVLGTPPIYIKDAVVQGEPSDNGQSAKVSVRVIVEGMDSTASGEVSGQARGSTTGVFYEIVEKVSGVSVGKSAVVPLVRKGNEWGEMHGEVVLQNPKLWTPENPELYLVKCFLVHMAGRETQVVDEYDVMLGVRKIASVAGHLQLNGKRLVLKGVTWYEDHPTWGSAVTEEEREKDVVLIKNLGANLIRCAGHPPHPYMLNLCDRYGLLVMEEIPVIQTPGPVLGTEAYAELASSMLREMIIRDRSHPSVLAWGLGDEFEASHPAARPFLVSLVRLARSLDSRLLYFGAVPGVDACTDLVDLAAVSVRTSETKLFRSQLEAWRSSHRQQPVIAAKFGPEVIQENRNGYSDPFSQEAQARFYLQRFDILKALDYDGGIVWSFNDWKGERPALTVHGGDPLMHSRGLVSSWREKRLAYDAVRSVFHGEKHVALPIGSHSTNAPIIYVLVGFAVLIGMAYVYNASRRFRENLNRSVLNSYNFFADVRDQRIATLAHSTLLGGVVSIACAVVASSVFFHFRDNLVIDNLLSLLLVSDDVKHIAVSLIWNPLQFIGIGAAAAFVLLLLTAGAVHALRALVRARIYAFHAYTVTMWSTAPLLILVPIGMILYRVMESSLYVIPSVILVWLLLFWILFRLLKGVSIILDIVPLKLYVIGVLALIVTGGLLYAYYDHAQSAPVYMSYLFSTLVHLQ